MHGLALCAGVGGLELGLRLACGDAYRTACFVEREAYPAAVLAARMGEGLLAPAPIWSDLRTFDARAWRGCVDLVSGGFPCQPFSAAGNRKGAADERHLWPHVLRVLVESGAALGFFENVRGHVSLGLREVLEDLARVGFHAEWDLFSAEEEGAPHIRERLFVLAYRDGDELRQLLERLPGRRAQDLQGGRQAEPGDHGTSGGVATRQDRHAEVLLGRANERGEQDGVAERSSAMADSDGRGLEVCRQSKPGRQQGTRRSELDGLRQDGGQHDAAAVGDSDSQPQGRDAQDVQARQPESGRRGWWRAEPNVGRVADGVASRVDRLRATGNGVVPAVAARAWCELTARAAQ